jgi:RHS repeat-associated protein
MYDVETSGMTFTGAFASNATLGIPPRYAGKERDTESGNDFFNARYYNSNTARFLSPDPLPWIGWQGVSKDYQEKFDMWIANPQNLNEYAYVNNNPMNHTDPTGMNACGTNDDKTCKVTITITARTKDKDGKYTDGKGHDDYNAIATVTVDDGKTIHTYEFLAKSTPDNSRTAGTVADGTYASIASTHHPGQPNAYPVISINSGHQIPTAFPNPNPRAPSEWTVDWVEIHKAGLNDAASTRDPDAAHHVSDGCQTILTSQYPEFERVTGLVPTAGAQQQRFTVILDANGGDE